MKLRFFLLLSSALLTALSFYKFDFLIFFSLIPFFLAIYQLPRDKKFMFSFIWGIFFFSILCFWITQVSIIGFILLVIYLSLYPGIYSLIAFRKNFQPLLLALLWVLLEYIRSFFLGGFPFGFLGYALYKRLYLIQIADILEVYGVSFVIIFTNASISYLFISGKLKFKILHLATLALLFLSSFLYSKYRIDKLHPEFYLSGIALAQTNVDPHIKWDPKYYHQNFLKFKYLYLTARYKHARLVIFPETIFPYLWNYDNQMESDIKKVIGEVKTPVIMGLPYSKKNNYYNASLFFDENAQVKGLYLKRHLVPFGEYIPLRKIFFWVEKIYPIANYASGERTPLFEFKGTKFGVLICYEIMFSNLIKDIVSRGADFIINQSDEGWFGKSSEIYLMHQIAVFRAIEARRTIVRVTNTGLTAVIDYTGRCISKLEPYRADVLVTSVPIYNK